MGCVSDRVLRPVLYLDVGERVAMAGEGLTKTFEMGPVLPDSYDGAS